MSLPFAKDDNSIDQLIANMSEEDRLLEIWKVLDLLTVSLDRIGNYELFHSQDAARDALHHCMSAKGLRPPVAARIANARAFAESLLTELDPVKFGRNPEAGADDLEIIAETHIGGLREQSRLYEAAVTRSTTFCSP